MCHCSKASNINPVIHKNWILIQPDTFSGVVTQFSPSGLIGPVFFCLSVNPRVNLPVIEEALSWII